MENKDAVVKALKRAIDAHRRSSDRYLGLGMDRMAAEFFYRAGGMQYALDLIEDPIARQGETS